MKTAVVVFPGSNCDHDAVYACQKIMGWDVIEVWHESHDLGGAELVILPGGFSYGDYLRCGAIAHFSPVMESVRKHAASGGLTLGICNGFQVLIEADMLPGALLNNSCMEFRCHWTHLKVQSTDNPFTRKLEIGDVLRIPIAHGEGNYFAPPDVLKQLNADRRIAFRYCNANGQTVLEANPNGSVESIAGVLNEGKNVLGMMPHPERASDDALGSSDGKRIFESLAAMLVDIGW